VLSGRRLSESDARAVVGPHGIRLNRTRLAKTCDEAINAADMIGYPVALKVVSPGIAHKSDVGGVRLALAGPSEVARAYEAILASTAAAAPDAAVEGVMVAEMIAGEYELVLGLKRDPTFGPTVLVGLGGVWVELLNDVALRVCPLLPSDAATMLAQLRAFPLLRGFRGRPPCDIAAVEQLILRVGEFAETEPSVLELDLNPVIVGRAGAGAIAVDVRLVVQE
jgi:acyl-CoA synthetase (NDP forming)